MSGWTWRDKRSGADRRKILETPEAPKPIRLRNPKLRGPEAVVRRTGGAWCGIQTGTHLLALAEAQEPDPEPLEFQQDVVDGRVGVAGQQHAEPAGVEDANLPAEAGT